MTAEIIAVGTEIILGDIVNTNAAYLAAELAQLGFDMRRQQAVGDNAARLADAINEARAGARLIVLCGGLGPTKDDLTKETAAAVFGLELRSDPKAQSIIDHYFMCRHMHEAASNSKQALVFCGGEVLYNDNGTAPGLFYDDGKTALLLLPGPPSELRPMFETKARPILEGLTGSTIFSKTLRIFGIGESELEERLGGIFDGSNPTVAPYAKTGEVHLRITAKAETQEAAERLVAQKQAEIMPFLKSCMYSDCGRSLAETVVDILTDRGLTVATAESMTGGGLAADLTAVPGASAVFGGGLVTYSEAAKAALVGVSAETLNKYTAVSRQTAAEMAKGAAKVCAADAGVAITGYAGPTGERVGQVFVAVCYEGVTSVRELSLGGMRSREYLRELARKNALDLLRRRLLGLQLEVTA